MHSFVQSSTQLFLQMDFCAPLHEPTSSTTNVLHSILQAINAHVGYVLHMCYFLTRAQYYLSIFFFIASLLCMLLLVILHLTHSLLITYHISPWFAEGSRTHLVDLSSNTTQTNQPGPTLPANRFNLLLLPYTCVSLLIRSSEARVGVGVRRLSSRRGAGGDHLSCG